MPGHFSLRQGAYAIQAGSTLHLARLFGLVTIVANAASVAVAAHLPVACVVQVRGMGRSGGGPIEVREWASTSNPQYIPGEGGQVGGLSQTNYVLLAETMTRGSVSNTGSALTFGPGVFPTFTYHSAGNSSVPGNIVFAGITRGGGTNRGNGGWINWNSGTSSWSWSNHSRTRSTGVNLDGGEHGFGGTGVFYTYNVGASEHKGKDGAAFLELI